MKIIGMNSIFVDLLYCHSVIVKFHTLCMLNIYSTEQKTVQINSDLEHLFQLLVITDDSGEEVCFLNICKCPLE